MDKNSLMLKLKKEKLIAVIKESSKQKIIKTVDAIYQGGINFIEITFTIPNSSLIIKELSEKYKNDNNIIIGAGNCLDVTSTESAILSGAKFIVSPKLDIEIIKFCNDYNIPYFPGISTIKEILVSLRNGAEIIKLSPADAYNPNLIQTFKNHIPKANFMLTGGINTENIKEWLKNDVVAVSIGTNLTKGANTNDFEAVKNEAKKFVSLVKKFKNEKK